MIQLVKLVTGELLIAQTETEGTTITLKNPMALRIMNEGVGMLPFCPFTENGAVKIDISKTIFVATPDQELGNAYNEKFGGIVTAPASIISRLS